MKTPGSTVKRRSANISPEAFTARIADWLGSAGDKSIIVVTHGIATRVLRGLYAGLPRTAALRLPVPQDRVFRLAEGTIDEIAIETPGAS